MSMNSQQSADHASLVERIRALSHTLEPRPTHLAPRILSMEGIRAVLFDVYGTLVVSASGDIAAGEECADTQAFRAALDAAGLKTASSADGDPGGPARVVEAIRASHARSRARGIEYPEVDIVAIWGDVLSGLTDASAVETAALRRAAVEYECRQNPVWPMPGAAAALAGLRERRLHLGIVSNAQFYTPLMLQALLGATPGELGFEADICAWSYQHGQAKPATALYQLVLDVLARRHGIPPAQVLYVGNDRLKDVWPASLLGCRTALFAGDSRSLRLRDDDERCRNVEPDLIVTELGQLALI